MFGQIGVEYGSHVDPLTRALDLAQITSVGSIRVNLCPHLDPNAPSDQRVLSIRCESLQEAANILRELARFMTPEEWREVGPPLLIRRDGPDGKMVGLMIFTQAIGRASLN